MDKETSKTRLELKPTQVVAGALAAVTAALLGSNLGVAGTVLGAGLASVVTTVGATLYQHSIDRARDTVRSRVGGRGEDPSEAETVKIRTEDLPGAEPERTGWSRRRWATVALGTVAAFCLGMLVIFGIEAVRGAPVSGGNNGTTLGALFNQPTETPAKHPAPGPTTTSVPPSGTPPTETTTATPPTSTTEPSTTTTPPPPTTTTTSPAAPSTTAPSAPPSRAPTTG
ncbi:hypothetical protein GCM10010174_90720 [Kutzneria viridogrisea]|uniref:Uncharacterized protein n=2 Tax=Kutzneria TaxID=43356 RepID=A0ABR6BW45_9PSEU|nr:hypothetical protein [Kutzneria albida]AHH93873.1 putative secreted protein [Kutzneria albida DSM 43870]MBA8931122.1 hypothetical protein [Kutzneria viridogrisea]